MYRSSAWTALPKGSVRRVLFDGPLRGGSGSGLGSALLNFLGGNSDAKLNRSSGRTYARLVSHFAIIKRKGAGVPALGAVAGCVGKEDIRL
jgi:hypothetical protein